MKEKKVPKTQTQRYKGHYCCAVNCYNNAGSVTNLPFYNVIRKSDPIQTEKWIKAINRTNQDGTPWRPGKAAKLCGKHFISKRLSILPSDPDYVPTIFPERPFILNIKGSFFWKAFFPF